MLTDNTQHRQEDKVYDNVIVGIYLSFLGGFLDAYSYLLKGGVFANAQTGNLIFLFISLANQNFHKCIKYIIPIIMFALGILISELLKQNKGLTNYHRVIAALLFEAEVIAVIGFTGTYFQHDVINCIISFTAAVQVAIFDKVDGNPMATTMITGNLKNSMINLSKYIYTSDRKYFTSVVTYFFIIVSFGVGVVIGFVTIKLYHEKSILICEIFIILSFFILRKERRAALKTQV